MIVLLYRWRIDPVKEKQFVENWQLITKHYVEKCGSRGSRLHRGSDGLYYGYAQWPDLETRERAVLDPGLEAARMAMREAVVESFTEIRLEPLSDHLIHNAEE